MLTAESHLPALGARDFAKLRKALGCDEASLKGVQQLISSLNPRPGNAFSVIGSEQYIQHEVIIKKVKGVWQASLNESVIPKLKVNQLYAGILKRNRDSSHQYLQSQLQEAKWMIKNIQQRFATILRVAQAITDRQRNFLEYGEVAMRPLVLREIAEELELHESTISRVTNNKYMLTPRGVFELKKTVFRQPNNRFTGQARHRGGAPHHRQIPRITQHSPGQLKKNPINPLPMRKELAQRSPTVFLKPQQKKACSP
jgi:RNA polymerase sigma-54 factor